MAQSTTTTTSSPTPTTTTSNTLNTEVEDDQVNIVFQMCLQVQPASRRCTTCDALLM